MKRAASLIIAFSMMLGNGCASIVSRSEWPVMVVSDPLGAAVTVRNEQGAVIWTAVTPASIMLRSGDGYFSKAHYTLNFEKEGYETASRQLSASVNNWYWGNIIFGGLIGMLAVDPGTGAMWKIDDFVAETMSRRPAAASPVEIVEGQSGAGAASPSTAETPASPAQSSGTI